MSVSLFGLHTARPNLDGPDLGFALGIGQATKADATSSEGIYTQKAAFSPRGAG
jgi:hypothetical protein